jgi:hypothetical protein
MGTPPSELASSISKKIFLRGTTFVPVEYWLLLAEDGAVLTAFCSGFALGVAGTDRFDNILAFSVDANGKAYLFLFNWLKITNYNNLILIFFLQNSNIGRSIVLFKILK